MSHTTLKTTTRRTVSLRAKQTTHSNIGPHKYLSEVLRTVRYFGERRLIRNYRKRDDKLESFTTRSKTFVRNYQINLQIGCSFPTGNLTYQKQYPTPQMKVQQNIQAILRTSIITTYNKRYDGLTWKRTKSLLMTASSPRTTRSRITKKNRMTFE